MSALAHVFERAGLATVGISLVRQQAERARAPRMLHCQFPLGRPLGVPGDPAFQRDVLRRALALLARDDVPVLEDHPVVIDDEADAPAACPLPPRHDPSLPAAVDEARGLRPAYDRNLGATGRTQIGRVADADGVPALVATLVRIAEGATLAEVGWDPPTLGAAAHDVRAYYEEAGAQLADITGARRLESWFARTTETGAVLRRAQQVLKDADAAFEVWYYLLPAAQHG